MTQVIQRNNHVLQMLKRLKETLENDKKKYADKVNVLVMTWERIAASAKEQRPLAAICIVEKMYKDTLSIMLQGEWPKMSPVSKTHLVQMLNRCRIDLCVEMPWLNTRFSKLLELVNDPWTLPSLERILHKDPSPATPEQIVEFCESERGLLIVTRLTMLCSSRCEKVAIKLAEACFGALSAPNSKLLKLFTTDEYDYIFDMYLCLLYKYKKLDVIINVLKTVSVSDGYYFVLRLKKRCDLHEQKIWKFSTQVAAIAARYFVTVSMLTRNIPNSTLLKNLICEWIAMCSQAENDAENEVRKVMQPAETSDHIYIMAEVLTSISQKLGNQKYSSLIMELYIRALTADINYLERVKLQNDKEQMTAYEKHLASKFLALADLVKDHSGVRREFVLTAFSIHPSAEIYRRVEEEAVASGKASPHCTPGFQENIEVGLLSEGLSSLSSEEPEGKETATDYSVNNDSQDSGAFVEIANRCPLHLPYDGIGPEGELCFQCGDFTGIQAPQSPTNQQQKKKERSLDALILIKGSTVTESLNYDVLSAPSQVLEAEKLGLSSQVCADLVTLLGSNRYHLLTWVLEWGELSSRCLRYMEEADTIKSGKKELKFLEIDYNQYKDWPENDYDEADCIEKGYEQWLEDENTETDFDTDSKRSNTDDSEDIMIKTAIKRSQKQMGRYAESSSDSEDSRSRPRSRKRGRPKKHQLKYYSDSGSISDSLGSDGQKQKRSNKKVRTKSKDLRKRLGRLKVLEMASEANSFSQNREPLSSSMLGNKVFGLPTSASSRSDPTVLKSLRAFRPNAHKTKTDEFVQSVTENIYNSSTVDDKLIPTMNSGIFDCNDNKFVNKSDKFSFANSNVEIHFKSNGVGAKTYNEMIRTIKKDLISVSNIPNVANNATVNVVHVQGTRKSDESSQSIQSTIAESRLLPVVTARNANSTFSGYKPKPENDTQATQIRRPTSSQSLNSNMEVMYSNTATTPNAGSINSVTKPGISGPSNQFLTSNIRSGTNKTMGQLQNMSKNYLNHDGNVTNQTQNLGNRSGTNSTGLITAGNIRNVGQNSHLKPTRAPVQSSRTAGVPPVDASRFIAENERSNVISSRTCGSQNLKSVSSVQHHGVGTTLGNGAAPAKRKDDAINNGRTNTGTSNSVASSDLRNQSYSKLSFENTIQNVTTSKSIDCKISATETVSSNANTASNSNCAGSSKCDTTRYSTESDAQFSNKSFLSNNSSMAINSNSHSKIYGTPPTLTNRTQPQAAKASGLKNSQTVILQTNVPVTNKNCSFSNVTTLKRSFDLPQNPLLNKILNIVEQTNVSSKIDSKIISKSEKEQVSSHFGLSNSVSGTPYLPTNNQNVSSVVTTTTSTASNKICGSSNAVSSKLPYNEVTNVMSTVDQETTCSGVDISEGESSNSVSRTSSGENSEEISNLDLPSGVSNGNIVPTVLKRSSVGRLESTLPTSNSSQYSISSLRNPVRVTSSEEGNQNVMVCQNSNSSTIHYTVVNPVQQKIQHNSFDSTSGDLMDKFVKKNECNASPIGKTNSDYNSGIIPAESSTNGAEKCGSLQTENTVSQQQIILESNKSKPSSSPPTVQNETNFIKKQVLNNQKITILVQNNDGDREKSENSANSLNSQKNKLNELLFRDDQKTCITFRAIKRTHSNGSNEESPVKKKSAQECQNGSTDNLKQPQVAENVKFTGKNDVKPSETLCQYLVLEAVNDPSGALPKFNQAFGKSYQIKIPQTVKPVESNFTEGSEGAFRDGEQGKSDAKTSSDQRVTPLPVQNHVPVTSRGGNSFEAVQKPVKSVYIDKEVKTSVQEVVKGNEGVVESSNISTIQMTEVQQSGTNSYQNVSKVSARSSVVQQLLRKVPTTGPPTLQAVNSVNTLTTRQVKAQEVVSGSTLIYATETRAQSQIVIQRGVGRVNNSTIGQATPVSYNQNSNDQVSSQRQTLLLAAVPTKSRGVVTGTQFVRLPSSSGVWKRSPAVNSSRIVQLRPQNLALQEGEEGLRTHQNGQPALLHHLTSLPVKPVDVINEIKPTQTTKMDVKNDIYNKTNINAEDTKLCSVNLEASQPSIKSETSGPTEVTSEHETVSLMKDIKEFENVFEETKLKFEMEEQQGGCLSEVENVTPTKIPLATATIHGVVNPVQSSHQTVLVQPQLLLHKPQMVIASAIQNQQGIFSQKIDKQLTLEKESEKTLILTTKAKVKCEEGSQPHVAVTYVSHTASPAVSVQKPLVVVTNYAQPPTSPAPSITSQNSSSPNSVVSSLSFTGSSSSKTSSKSQKPKIPKSVPNPSKSPPVSKVQQKSQEDANTAQKIYAILEEYAVQLRNSPDMNNRPAPRRRSNPPLTPHSKRRKTSSKSKESFSDGDESNFVDEISDHLHSSEDSSNGVTVLQVCVSSSH